MNKVILKSILPGLVVAMCAFSVEVLADRDKRDWIKERDKERVEFPAKPAPAPPGADFRVDKRFDHDHSYPRDGFTVNKLPRQRHPIRYRDRSYFYISGIWYIPSGPNFVVVHPPIGIVVPILPPYYTTIWYSGIPYYYANEVYYVWRPDLNGYQVTEPPIGESDPAPPLVAEELFAYPKEGQSEEQQAEDRYACHRWAVDQTRYDPTQPPQNLPVNELSRLRDDYQRAMKACLEGRGYSVR